MATTALAGVASIVLQLGGQSLMGRGATQPTSDAPAGEIQSFFESVNTSAFAAGSYLATLGLAAMLWFVGGVFAILRPNWRAPIGFGFGLAHVVTAAVGWELAVFRIDEGVDPQLSRLAFDLGNLSFASSWVGLAGFVLATSWALRTEGIIAFWMWALGAGASVCLVAARAAWTTQLWVGGYGLFVVWIIALCVVLLRRMAAPASGASPLDAPSDQRAVLLEPESTGEVGSLSGRRTLSDRQLRSANRPSPCACAAHRYAKIFTQTLFEPER